MKEHKLGHSFGTSSSGPFKAESFCFKSWLVMENPDEVRFPVQNKGDSISSLISNRPHILPWRDGITFAIFDSYCLISKKGMRVLHESMAFRIKECERAVQAALRKEISYKELSDCITSPDRRSGQLFLESKGEISDKTISMFLETIELMNIKTKTEKDSSKPAFVAYRNLSLQKTPEVVLGRIWSGKGSQERAVSFWNKPQDILGQKDKILSFVSSFGDPTTYYYDVQDKVLSYEQFMQNKTEDSPKFDTSIVHSMPPSQIKTQLQNMIGTRKSRPIDVRTRQLAQTSESFERLLELWNDIGHSGEALPLPESALNEARRRRAEMVSNPDVGSTHQEIWKRIREARHWVR